MRSTAARVRRRLARPTEAVERTRWLFFVIALVSLLLTAPAALAGAHHVQPVLLGFSGLALVASWTHRYLTRSVVVGFDLLDVVAVAAFALASPMPAVAFGIVFPAMWFRVMYGRTWRVGLYAVALGAALVGATLAWGLVPGNGGSTDVSPVLSSIPVLGLTFIGARHLALGMLQREQTRGRNRRHTNEQRSSPATLHVRCPQSRCCRRTRRPGSPFDPASKHTGCIAVCSWEKRCGGPRQSSRRPHRPG